MLKKNSILLILIISTIRVYSQCYIQEILYTNDLSKSESGNHMDKELIYIIFDINKLYTNDKLYLEFKDGEIVNFEKNYAEYRSEEDFYVGYKCTEGEISLSVLENNVIGYISHKGVTYYLENFVDNIYTLRQTTSSINKYDMTDYVEDIGQEDMEITSFSSNNENTFIRVLVLFTNDLGFSSIEMRNKINLYTGYANDSFVNSQIWATLQIVYIGTTDYRGEKDANTVLRHFRNSSDGYMNEVHTLRDKYSADICVLITDIDGLCGKAQAIQATNGSAFVVVNPDNYCEVNFSFVHEIGHLIGCRHDRQEDANIVPYIYCHGFVHLNDTNSWRTIMAYENSCYPYSCQRIKNWSNPYVQHEGFPTGDETWCNNARVWNNRKETVSHFRVEPNSTTLTNDDINNSSYSWLIAEDNISTLGVVNISGQQVVNIQAHTIHLTEGFHAENGSNVHIISDGSNLVMASPTRAISSQDENPAPAVVNTSEHSNDEKIIRDGQLYIRKDGHVYNSLGLMIE